MNATRYIVAVMICACCSMPSMAQLHEGWGVRLGALMVDDYPGAHPAIQVNYECATATGSPLTMLADLTLAYIDFADVQFPSYDEHVIQDYGFHGGVRYLQKQNAAWSLFESAQLGFDVYPDPISPDPGHVSASFPLSAGALYDLSTTSQLEFSATARPLWYFRQAWGFSYAITLGLRFF